MDDKATRDKILEDRKKIKTWLPIPYYEMLTNEDVKDVMELWGKVYNKALRINIIRKRLVNRGKYKNTDIDNLNFYSGPRGNLERDRNNASLDYSQDSKLNFRENQIKANQRIPGEAKAPRSLPLNFVKNRVTLVDIDYNGEKPYKSIELPFIPRELEFEPESSIVRLSPIGRNNPHYQFTGSEDSLRFTIEWLSNQLDRADVIEQCRWVESLTKVDGYYGSLHRLRVIWGNNAGIFKNHIWVVEKAKYVVKRFNNGYIKDGKFISTNLNPQIAKQDVVLKRITTTNLRLREMF